MSKLGKKAKSEKPININEISLMLSFDAKIIRDRVLKFAQDFSMPPEKLRVVLPSFGIEGAEVVFGDVQGLMIEVKNGREKEGSEA